MKILDILESNIIDFNKAKQNRVNSKTLSVDFDLNRHQNNTQSDIDNFELLIDWIREFKQNFRIPSFEGLDSIFNYLHVGAGIPADKNSMKEWLGSLNSYDRSIVMMIANHADRIYKALNEMLQKVEIYYKSSKDKNLQIKLIKFVERVNKQKEILQNLSAIR